ncbi:hypothetical protein AAC387_Pa02g1344 [Persea americana]
MLTSQSSNYYRRISANPKREAKLSRSDEFRETNKLDILMPPERSQRGIENGDCFREKKRYDGRDKLWPPSPPPPVSYRDHRCMIEERGADPNEGQTKGLLLDSLHGWR